MGKNQRRRETQNQVRAPVKVTGRPQNNPLQKFFMNKLRQGKLQVINAQSQAELALYNFHQKGTERHASQSTLIENKLAWIREWFYELDPIKYKPLWRSFELGARRYEFIQIKDEKDFPEYLFCDHCDLSYVLHEALHSEIEELVSKTQFSSDQLLFLELICFASRDMISFKVLRSLKRYYQLILGQMSVIKSKIIYHYELQQQQQRQVHQSRNRELSIQFNATIRNQQLQGMPDQILNLNAEQVDVNHYLNKSKRIQKKNHKKGRPPKINQLSTPVELSIQQIAVVSHKLLTHIAWAYRYILHEEIKKKAFIVTQ